MDEFGPQMIDNRREGNQFVMTQKTMELKENGDYHRNQQRGFFSVDHSIKKPISHSTNKIRGRKIQTIKINDNGQIQSKLLLKLLTHIVEADKRIEVRREVLGEIPEFEPYQAFQNILCLD